MNNWKTYKAEDLTKNKILIIGDGYRAKNSELSNDGLPFARGANINQGFLFDDAECLDKSNLHRAGEKISRVGDVVFTSKGTVGRFAFVRENTKQFVYSPQLCYWRVLDRKFIDSRYLYFWMYGREFFEQYSGVKNQTDMADYVSLNNQRRFHITLPPIKEQKAIVRVLSSLDDKIELNRQMSTTLEAMAHAIFKAWFVDFEPVRANSENRPSESASPEIAKLFPSEFENDIPKGWKNVSFGDLFSFVVDNRGKTPPRSSEGFKLLEGYQIFCDEPFPDFSNSDKQKYISEETYNSQKWFRTKHPQFLDILCATVGTLPKWCFAPHKIDFGIAQNIVAFRVNEKISSPFFTKCLMNTEDFLWNFRSRIVTTAQPSIKVGPLKAIPIILPSKDLINEFDKAARPIYAKLEQIYYQDRTLSEIRDSLLPRLISGKIRVGEAENETANAL